MKEIIYPDLCPVAKKAITLPKWKELLAIKNTFLNNTPITMLLCQLFYPLKQLKIK